MDKKTIIKAQAGDAEALSLIYEKMYKRVYYLALRMTGSPEDAEDAAQETFIAAFDSIGNLEKPEAFESWLFQICSNRCRNTLRKNSRTVALEEDEEGNTILDDMADPNESIIPETALQDAEQRRLIMETVQALPQNQKECVLMFYFSGIGVKEIAAELGCSEGTVKSRLNYARAKIKESILAIEKRDGIRLHSFAPIGLLLMADMETVTGGLAIPALGAAGAAAAATGTAAATTAATTAKAAAGVALKTKIIAGVTAAAVATGGGVAIYEAVKQPAEPSPYVEFADANMEHNMHLLLGIPVEEPILKETLAEIDAVFFVGDGMSLMSDDWIVGWMDHRGYFSATEVEHGQPFYAVEEMTPVEGTLPVTNLVDLQYIGGEALWIGTLDSETAVDSAVLAGLFPDCAVRNTPHGGVNAPFYGAYYWTGEGEVHINSPEDLARLDSYAIIRNPEYVDFADPVMERSMHILLEVPEGEGISLFELNQVHQVEFYEGRMDMFNGFYWSGAFMDLSGTGVPVSFEDLKYFSSCSLLVTAATPQDVDKEAILAVCPDAEFHYFMGEYELPVPEEEIIEE